MNTEHKEVELLQKNRPQQQRAIRTYESILDAAAELLVEVGLERISTNLIAERAGITVPALYRYFPNKYSVLNALGERLMERQGQAFRDWYEQKGASAGARAFSDIIEDILGAAYQVTRSMVGGVQIMHSLQAIAPLQRVRLDHHWNISEAHARNWAERFGVEFQPVLVPQARVAIELAYATVQLAIEDDRCDPELALREGAQAIGLYIESALRAIGLQR